MIVGKSYNSRISAGTIEDRVLDASSKREKT